jgi:hypothetical protein
MSSGMTADPAVEAHRAGGGREPRTDRYRPIGRTERCCASRRCGSNFRNNRCRR